MSLIGAEGLLPMRGHQLGGSTVDGLPRLIGRGTIVRKNSPEFVPCELKISQEYSPKIGYEYAYSDVVCRTVTVFEAHVPGTEDIVGRCTVKIMLGISDCVDRDYQTKRVACVLNVESPKREEYQGVGSLLMRAAIEYGISQDTEGRIAVYSVGDALGFYSKLGMQSGSKDDPVLMYLPKKEIAIWRRVMMRNPVLYVQK